MACHIIAESSDMLVALITLHLNRNKHGWIEQKVNLSILKYKA